MEEMMIRRINIMLLRNVVKVLKILGLLILELEICYAK
nr:MAG TPA: hypothetical protein [Caudoviricetes sp.]